MNHAIENAWLPDYLYVDGRFQTDLAMFADQHGRITRFSGAREELKRAQRLTNRAIMPGLINVHSHAFQRAIRARTEHRTDALRDTFWTWREAMYHAANQLSPEDIYEVSRMAFMEMLLAGITTVGEFHYLHHASDGSRYENVNLLAECVLQAASDIGIRIALLNAAYARPGWNRTPNPGQARFITPHAEQFIADTEELQTLISKRFAAEVAWVGIAPHSIRAVPLDYLLQAVEYARSRDMVVHMHVSEQPAEIEACIAEHGCTPVELLHRHGILDQRFTGVHVIHIGEAEIGMLGKAGAKVAACPTTERNLGDGIAPVDHLIDQGCGICYGSDSNIQINLLEDARELEYHLRLQRLARVVLTADCDREALSRRLLADTNIVAASSLQAPGGVLAVGGTADFISVNLDDPSIAGADKASLFSHIVFAAEKAALGDVYVGGKHVIADGRHPLQQEVLACFGRVQRKLWRTQ